MQIALNLVYFKKSYNLETSIPWGQFNHWPVEYKRISLLQQGRSVPLGAYHLNLFNPSTNFSLEFPFSFFFDLLLVWLHPSTGNEHLTLFPNRVTSHAFPFVGQLLGCLLPALSHLCRHLAPAHSQADSSQRSVLNGHLPMCGIRLTSAISGSPTSQEHLHLNLLRVRKRTVKNWALSQTSQPFLFSPKL